MYGSRVATLENTTGHECATAAGERLSIHSRSRNPSKHTAHVSTFPTPLTTVGIEAFFVVLSWLSWSGDGQIELPRSHNHCKSMLAVAIIAKRSGGGRRGRQRSVITEHALSITSMTGSSSFTIHDKMLF